MLTLNLISHKARRDIKIKRVYEIAAKIILVFITFFAVIAIILLAINAISTINFNNTVNQTSLVIRNNEGYDQKVREINAKLDAVEKIQDNFTTWSKMLENLQEITPDDIYFSSISVDKNKLALEIRGKAASRESLLSLKKNLEDSPIYFNVEFPIKNILEKENVDFDISANIRLEKL